MFLTLVSLSSVELYGLCKRCENILYVSLCLIVCVGVTLDLKPIGSVMCDTGAGGKKWALLDVGKLRRKSLHSLSLDLEVKTTDVGVFW